MTSHDLPEKLAVARAEGVREGYADALEKVRSALEQVLDDPDDAEHIMLYLINPYRTFTCESCGETFTKARSDEEAAAEAAGAFTAAELEDPALVCDPCWRRMCAAMPDLAARYGPKSDES